MNFLKISNREARYRVLHVQRTGFLYATSFFPNASTYVLAGLEPVGAVPDLMSISPLVIDGELRSLEASMSSLFRFGFFITHKMKTQLREGQFYGALPILYVFLARTSKTIYEVNFCASR